MNLSRQQKLILEEMNKDLIDIVTMCQQIVETYENKKKSASEKKFLDRVREIKDTTELIIQ